MTPTQIKAVEKKIEKIHSELENVLSIKMLSKVYDLVNYELIVDKECNQ